MGVLFRKLLPMAACSSIVPILSCGSSFHVSGLILRSLIHFELMLVQDERLGSSFSFLPTDIQFPQCHLLIKLFFLQHVLGSIVKNQMMSCVDSYLGCLFCSTGLHVCFCASTMQILLLWFCSIVWSQVSWYLQYCSFLFNIGLAIWDLLHLQMNVRIVFSIRRHFLFI
jgi:hypothetical protein